MVAISEKVDIDVPLEEAFSYFAEFAHIAEWDPGVAASSKHVRRPLCVGDTYDVMSVFVGRKLPMRYEVLDIDAPHRIVLRGVAEGSEALDTIRFESLAPSRTRIHWKLELSLHGLAKYSEPFMRPLLSRLGKNTMRGIREAAALGYPRRFRARAPSR